MRERKGDAGKERKMPAARQEARIRPPRQSHERVLCAKGQIDGDRTSVAGKRSSFTEMVSDTDRGGDEKGDVDPCRAHFLLRGVSVSC